ncbi:34367_t:CDS:1, partial [Gigaspora margarita]
ANLMPLINHLENLKKMVHLINVGIEEGNGLITLLEESKVQGEKTLLKIIKRKIPKELLQAKITENN